jgi:hypothetical protein
MLRRALILAALFLTALPAHAATLYVWCNATGGSPTGADFTTANAFHDLPSSLVRGNTYVVAGDAGCTYGQHNFNDVESGTTLIAIRKAVAALDSGVTGWTSTFATAPSTWTVPQNSDFQSIAANIQPLWHFCRSYYTVNGETGISDPSLGGPSGYGFVLRSGNNHFIGLLGASTNGCGAGSGVQLTNITVSGFEVNGVNNYSSAAIQAGSCTYVSTTVTVTLNPTPSWTLSVNDMVEIDTAIANGTAVTPSSCCTVTNVSSWPTVSFTAAANPCTGLPSTAVLGNNFGGAAGIYILGIGTTNTYATISVSQCYVHDTAGSNWVTAGINGFVLQNCYTLRNRYTPLQHANGWDDHVLESCCVTSNVTVGPGNWWQDIVGTAVIAIFNAGSGGTQALATETNWNIFGNAFFETTPSILSNSQLISCFGTGVQPVACSHFKIFNNSTYNFSSNANGTNARIGWFESDPSSVDIEVYDNIWALSNNVQPQVSSGSVCYNQTAACAATAQLISDWNLYDSHNTGLAPSDANGEFTSVNPATFFTAVGSNNFGLTAHTNNLLDTHSLLAANDTDPHSVARCVGGGCPGTSTNWDAGMFQFPGSGGPVTAPAPAIFARRGGDGEAPVQILNADTIGPVILFAGMRPEGIQ